MQKKILITILSLAATGPLMAQDNHNGTGLFVEPMVTYEKLDSKVNYPSPYGSSDGKSDGFGAGLRLGGHIYDVIFVGLDGRYSKLDYVASGGDYKADADSYNYGVIVGAQLPTPISLRVWGGYVLGGQFDPDKANNLDVKFRGGSGYRIGTGLELVGISFNLEYQKITYDNATVESYGPFNSGENFDNVELKNDGYVLSESFPYSM